MIFEVFFDTETKKLFNEISSDDPGLLGVSITSVLERELDDAGHVIRESLRSYWERDFPDMWAAFRRAHRVVGFNSKGFDVPVLLPYAPSDFKTFNHFDILEQVRNSSGKRMSLNSLAEATLGKGKIDVGTNAVAYWNKGDEESLAKLKKYCEEDVRLTRDLYDYAVSHKHLRYRDKWNALQTIILDFSYPKRSVSDNGPQMSLF